jgi:hypothetical protein
MMYYAIPEQLIPASQGLSRLSKATIAQKADMMHYAIPEQLIPAFQGPSRLSKATIAQKSQKTKPKVKGSNVPPPKQSCNDPSQQFIPVNTLPHLPSALQVSFVTPSTNAVSKGYAPMPPTTSAQSAPTNPEKVQLTQDLEIKEKQLRAKERSLKIRETALRKQELELQEQTEQCNALKSLTNSLETKVTLLQDENRLFKLKLLALEDVQGVSPQPATATFAQQPLQPTSQTSQISEICTAMATVALSNVTSQQNAQANYNQMIHNSLATLANSVSQLNRTVEDVHFKEQRANPFWHPDGPRRYTPYGPPHGPIYGPSPCGQIGRAHV